ncbi:MAG: bifunctional phosphoribosylaminoimidazolecarboxamide formyltransferase/IMP cyclohydrolase, partial [Candidatus Kariarchaeaceae archaeon]
AAKNSEFVTVITDPNDYSKVVRLWPEVPDDLKIDLATKAFDYVSQYDRHISSYFQNLTASPKFTVEMQLQSKLRYGENSHQTAEYYVDKEPFYNQISGPDLSYNNLLDIGSGLDLLSEFEDPSCVIIKHRTPCGVASAQELKDAYLNALATDSLSAYGGVFLLNRQVDLNTAKELATMFVDVLIAPGYASGVLEVFSTKSKIKILTYDDIVLDTRLISQVPGGIVVQDRDMTPLTDDLMEVRSQKKPDIQTVSELKFAWKIVKHAKSNAIVVCKASRALGIGSGQTSRVEAAESAIRKSGADAKGAVLASDAFFPFADSIELVAGAGIRAVIAPKGSIRDQEVVDAANRLGLILVFTSIRAFKH